MAELAYQFNPEDSFAREEVAVYSSAITDVRSLFIRYHDMESVLNHYTFKDELEQIEITHFISNNWFLVPVLKEAPDRALAYFGDGTVLVLEELIDPEDGEEDGYGDEEGDRDEVEEFELFIIFRTRLGLKESMERFDQLFIDWYDRLDLRTKLILGITVESKDEF
jgi:hypothetical protein